jgi:hypothetical protein
VKGNASPLPWVWCSFIDRAPGTDTASAGCTLLLEFLVVRRRLGCDVGQSTGSGISPLAVLSAVVTVGSCFQRWYCSRRLL